MMSRETHLRGDRKEETETPRLRTSQCPPEEILMDNLALVWLQRRTAMATHQCVVAA